MSQSAMSFGQKLKALRQNENKSQGEVASEIASSFGEGIRISQTTLSALEKRESAPREDVLNILASYYGVPITYFFDSDESGAQARAKEYLQRLRSGELSHIDVPFANVRGLRSENDGVADDIDQLLTSIPDDTPDSLTNGS